jgi:hypothetical protein
MDVEAICPSVNSSDQVASESGPEIKRKRGRPPSIIKPNTSTENPKKPKGVEKIKRSINNDPNQPTYLPRATILKICKQSV